MFVGGDEDGFVVGVFVFEVLGVDFGHGEGVFAVVFFFGDPAEVEGGGGAGGDESLVFDDGVEDFLFEGGGVDEVDFVEDINFGGVPYSELGENGFDDFDFGFDLGVVDVDDMHDEVGFDGFGEGGFEGFDEEGRQVTNETDGIGDQDFTAAFLVFVVGVVLDFILEIEFADAGVEGGEELVGDIGSFVGEGVEEGAFAGVGVADESDGFEVLTPAALAVSPTDVLVVFEFVADVDFLALEVAFHHFGVGFSLSGTKSDGSGLSGEFHSHVEDARAHVLDGGEFDLEFGFGAFGVLIEDFEDEVDSIPDVEFVFEFQFAEFFLEVEDLARFEDVVDDDGGGSGLDNYVLEFFDFSGADVGAVFGEVALLDYF